MFWWLQVQGESASCVIFFWGTLPLSFFVFLQFLALQNLHDCLQTFSSFSGQRLLSSCGAQVSHCGGFACRRAVSREGSVVVVHRLSCWGMWNLPRPGIEPMSPALAGEFFTTGPPGKSRISKQVFACLVLGTVWDLLSECQSHSWGFLHHFPKTYAPKYHHLRD